MAFETDSELSKESDEIGEIHQTDNNSVTNSQCIPFIIKSS